MKEDQYMLLLAHQESWAEDFRKIKKVLCISLKGLDVDVEHIGSTSINQIVAKPIIDIDIVFNPNVRFGEIERRLSELNYTHNGDQGIKDREAFKRIKSEEQHGVLDSISHHLYVCPSQSLELKRHLSLRDYLNENESARKEYERIKIQIAEEANQDRKVYAKLKETRAREFIESILKKAESTNKK
jgi:GrpB-like predicted nucleotidyltransferase (UPF0157 family)